MNLLSSFKAFGLGLADKLNTSKDPFDSFTRATMPKDRRPLHEQEKDYFQDLQDFWVCQRQVLTYRVPLPAGSPLDLGDQALWHGVYTAMLSLRYHVLHDDQTQDLLLHAGRGLSLHQTAHGETDRRLIRGVSDDLTIWMDDASNDSATGHLLGIYFLWLFSPAALQTLCRTLVSGLATELLVHGHALVKADHSPTTYGALDQGWKTDPLRITLALAVYAVAYTICDSKRFLDAFCDLYQKYKALIPYAKSKLLWLDNQNDTHRAAIHLAILSSLGFATAESFYGLARLYQMALKDGNVWVLGLCSYGYTPNLKATPLVKKVLSEFSLDSKRFNVGRDNYPISAVYAQEGLKAVQWGGVYRSSQPLPRWDVRSQDFFWQRNLRSLDVGSTGAQADSRHNMGDWLSAYWLARQTGILNETD